MCLRVRVRVCACVRVRVCACVFVNYYNIFCMCESVCVCVGVYMHVPCLMRYFECAYANVGRDAKSKT